MVTGAFAVRRSLRRPIADLASLTPKAASGWAALGLGGPGRLLSQGSHGPGRADFPHPVRQVMALLRDRSSARHEEVAEEIPRATDSCAPKSALFSKIVG